MLTETVIFWSILGSLMILGIGATVGLMGYACLTSAEIEIGLFRRSHGGETLDERSPIVQGLDP